MKVMKILLMAFGVFLLLSGLFIIMIGLFAIFTQPEELRKNLTMTLVLGLLPAILGAGICTLGTLQMRRTRKEALEKQVFQLAKMKGGRLTVAELTLETNLTSDKATAYLDDLHHRSLVDMDVSDSGTIFFRFPGLAD